MASGNSYRDTNVVVIELESGEFYIVASLSSRKDTQVISVDPTTGALRYTGQEQIDNFQSEAEAVKFITSGSKWPVKSAAQARSILGYAALGGVGLLLLATKVRASIQDLPNGDCVYTVMESQWVKIPLRNPQPQSKAETKNAADLTDIAIDGMHFFCETRDVTRPFPSNASVDDPDFEFCWNIWLSSPFKDIGLQRHCAVLLQGIADSRTFADSKGQYATVALIARRSRLHPGTRYLARGLNAAFSTGNEVECEQLVWPSGLPPGKPVPFSSYLWRRGTIPIWWGAEIKSTVAEAEIYISETDTYKGSAHYFQRLVFRYGTKERRPVPIVCVNLLRGAVGKSEVPLLQHFQECVNRLRDNKDLGDAVLCLLNYDWHANIKLIGDMKTVDGLWQILQAPTMDIGFKLGICYPSSGRPGGWKITDKQAGVIRFNCADSLDRTNAASFFGGVQVFAEQCRKLGISLDSPRSSLEPRRSISNGPLPEGWERRRDTVTGQIFYVDHNTRKTTWDHPCPDEAWHRFAMTAEEFKFSTLAAPIAMLADLFLIAGDIHATQYTGSKAMHSQILHIFGEDAAKAKRAGAAQNMAITLHRRYLNVLVDNTRQKQLEMFLGLHRYQHFPSVAQRPLQIMTRSHACLLKPIPSAFPNLYPPNAMINVKCKDMIWICNPAAEIVEVFILLSEPCHVCQLLITLAHGMEDTTSPASFDVRAGRHLDGMKVLLEGVSLPRCANGTQVLYSLPGAMSSEDVAITGGQYLPWLYEYEESEGELDFLTRFVSVTFYRSAPGVPITLGEVEVIGLSLFSSGIWQGLDQTPQDTVSGTFGLEALDLSNGTSLNHPVDGIDLLTGDFTGPVRQSSSATPNRPVERVLSRKATVRRQSSDEAQRYCDKLMMLCENNLAKQLSYSEAMELELLRLGLGLSAAERDRILLSCGKDPATLNPNTLMHRSNLSPLRQAAMQLHILNQIVSEDEELRAIGLPPKPQERAGSPNHPQACSHKDCEVVIMRKGSMVQGSSTLTAISVCNGCRRKVCSTCLAGKGSAALASIQGPVGASASSGVNRDRASFDAAFCKKCCPPLMRDAILLHSLRQLLYRRKKLRFESAVLTANQFNAAEGVADYSALLKGEASLAVYPKSTFLFSVPSDPRFEQAMSLISPEPRSFWMAPAKTSSVELAVVLGQPSVVSGVILLVSPCGYTLQDVPIVEAWCGTTVSDSDRKCVGKWDINAASGTPQQQLFGPEANVNAGPENPRHLVYRFPSPTRCRIVWIRLSLSGGPVQQLNQPMDLISFDPTTQGGRKSHFLGGGPAGTPRLHARGILVTGQKLPEDFFEASSNSQTSDKLAWKSMIEAPPKFGRLKVQTDSERFNEAGRVIELVISQTAPNVSGFRLDALLALKSVVKHTPLSNKPRTLSGAFEAMDEFSLNPVPLSIRVMAVQASDQPVFVGNFTLPMARAGTVLYFDFGALIEARALYFELNGDFSSYLDDEAGADTDSKEVPLPASISLSGKIKLYRYAPVNELGKWPQLYSV